MFRFLHAADAHIDSPMEGLSLYDGAPTTRLRGATRTAFENLVLLAIQLRVDFVLIAGDLYDGDWRDYSTGLFLSRQMKSLANAGIPVFIIAGNHDAASVLTRQLELPDNVHHFSTRTAESKLVPGLPVVLHGRGFPHRAVPENLVPDYPAAAADCFNIGLLHTSLAGAAGHDTYAPCSLQDLTDKGYQYWALGHIHQPQILRKDPWIVFPGNTQGRHVGECGPRGCRIITVADDLTVESNEFHPLDVVRWERVEAELTGVEDYAEIPSRIAECLRRQISAAEGRLLAIRLQLTGTTLLHTKLKSNLPALRAECLNQAQLVADDQIWIERVRVETTPLIRPEELAERDELTRIVLDSLRAAELALPGLPDAVRDLLKALPADLRTSVEEEWSPDNLPALIDDVRSVLLEAIVTKSGEA